MHLIMHSSLLVQLCVHLLHANKYAYHPPRGQPTHHASAASLRQPAAGAERYRFTTTLHLRALSTLLYSVLSLLQLLLMVTHMLLVDSLPLVMLVHMLLHL